MFCISILFVYLTIFVRSNNQDGSDSGSESKPTNTNKYYNYFIGQGDSLAGCREAKSNIDTSKDLNCNKYSSQYYLFCENDFIFTCNENDNELGQIDFNEYILILIIGSNETNVDLTKLQSNPKGYIIPELDDSVSESSAILLQDINKASFVPTFNNKHKINAKEIVPKTTVNLKGCDSIDSTFIIQLLKIKVIERNLNLDIATLNYVEIVKNEFNIHINEVQVDQYTLDNLPKDSLEIADVIHSSLQNEGDDYYNLTITFTQDSWNISGFSKTMSGSNIEYSAKQSIIPYFIAKRVFVIAVSENVVFNIDDSSTTILKTVEINSTESDLSFISTGNWDSLSCEPLTVIFSENNAIKNYNTDLVNKDHIIFTTPAPLPPRVNNIYYFIGDETEVSECRSDKEEIEADKTKCSNYEDKYSLDCYDDFVMFCEDNDYKFEEITSQNLTYGNIQSINIMIGSNSPIIDLSKLQKFDQINIESYGEFKEYPTKSVSFKGEHKTLSRFTIFSLGISIQNTIKANLLYLYYTNVTTANNLYIQSGNLILDEYTAQNLNSNVNIRSNRCEMEKAGYENATITFTENSWHIVDYGSTKTNNYVIPYIIAERFYLSVTGQNLTFSIDDPVTAKLKTIEIYSSQSHLAFISTGNWDSLNCDPLTVLLNSENNVDEYNTDKLNNNYINFIPNIYPQINIYYFVGNKTEVEECKAIKDDIEKDKSSCTKYSENYDFDCDSEFEIFCEENSNRIDEFTYKNIGEVIIYIGSNSPVMSLSKLSRVESNIFIIPFVNITEILSYTTPIRTVSLKGCELPKVDVYLMYLNVVVVENNMTVRMLVIEHSKLLESSTYYFKGSEIALKAEDLGKNQAKSKFYFDYIRYFTYATDNVTVSFTDDSWYIIDYKIDDNTKEIQKIEAYAPYYMADKLYIIINGEKLYLNVDDQSTAVLKSIEISVNKNNLTVISTGKWVEPLIGPLYAYCGNMNQLDISALDENWFKFNEDPIVEIPPEDDTTNSAPEDDTTNSAPDDDTTNSAPEDDKTNSAPVIDTTISAPPVIVNDTTKKDNYEVGTIELDKIEEDKFKDEIESLFNASANNDTIDQSSDHIVTIKSSGEQIEFKDLTLNENQYLKVENNANVKLTSGQLNLVLDDTSSSVNVVVNSADVSLSIKNMDDCTIKIDVETSEEKKNISITSNSEVYGPLNFEVGYNVDKITIASINLHDSGSVKSTVPVTVEKLSAQPKTTGKLSNVIISNEFSISQSAVLELDEVSLDNANINLNLHTYSSSNYDTPILNGTLGSPPSTIVLVKPEKNDNTIPTDNEKFLLFQGTFTTPCNQWKETIDYGDTYFNDCACDPIQELRILKGEKMSFNVFRRKQPDDNKLSAGQIAGIVIGCVLGVAIIVGVVVFIIIKKKKNKQSSGAESAGEQVDL